MAPRNRSRSCCTFGTISLNLCCSARLTSSRLGLRARTDSTSRDDLASTVATHFHDELDADEDEVIPRFVKFMMNYNGGNDANVLAKQKAQQKKTRK